MCLSTHTHFDVGFACFFAYTHGYIFWLGMETRIFLRFWTHTSSLHCFVLTVLVHSSAFAPFLVCRWKPSPVNLCKSFPLCFSHNCLIHVHFKGWDNNESLQLLKEFCPKTSAGKNFISRQVQRLINALQTLLSQAHALCCWICLMPDTEVHSKEVVPTDIH